MKVNGRKIDKPQIEIVVLPRREGDLIFKAAPIVDYQPFLDLCPAPIPPTIMQKGGIKTQDVEDKDYKLAIDVWATQRTNWMIIKSLQATEGLEWETVNFSDNSTWGNFRTELESSGLNAMELNMIIGIVVDANGLNQKKIEDATKSFLAGQVDLVAKP